MTWPVTPVGSVASVSCPCGVSDPMIQQLMATRRCRAGTDGSYGVWEEPQCDSCMFSQTTLALCGLTEVSKSPWYCTLQLNWLHGCCSVVTRQHTVSSPQFIYEPFHPFLYEVHLSNAVLLTMGSADKSC